MTVFLADRFQNANRAVHDLGADAVAPKKTDIVFHNVCVPFLLESMAIHNFEEFKPANYDLVERRDEGARGTCSPRAPRLVLPRGCGVFMVRLDEVGRSMFAPTPAPTQVGGRGGA